MKQELLVSGYIRNNCTMDIPKDIILLCLKWYKIERDYWNTDEYDKERVTINEAGTVATGCNSMIFGSMIISRWIQSKVWRLKVQKPLELLLIL